MEITPTLTFDAFWQAYPRKTGGKPKAEIKFNSLSDVDKHNAIVGARYHAENNPQWRNPTLIPHATTFLNQSRWLDEIVEDKDAKARVAEEQNKTPAHMVWSAMTQMYGEAWIKRHGERPTEIWHKMLKGMSMDRLKRGLRATLESGSEFPPSLPRFIECCAKRFDEIYPTALPKPKGDKELAFKALDEMKQILGDNK